MQSLFTLHSLDNCQITLQKDQLYSQLVDKIIEKEGDLQHFLIKDKTVTCNKNSKNKIVMSGSFNPFHQGHYNIPLQIQQIISNQSEIVFELGVYNPDKNDISKEEIIKRIEQFVKRGLDIKISRKQLYFQINQDYTDSYICVGYDTIIRIFMEKYYENGKEDIAKGFMDIRNNNNKLAITGRQSLETGKFLCFNQYIQENKDNYIGELYKQFEDIFIELSEEQFRIDISSTQIRNKTKNNELG